ncbi:hypothetical protein RFI_07924 [Reticulomyxa filosa]|uniref:Uncharacterized protein n=1 Tax=Reticulomyxa filosa TaxID=46433 RepID=X6NTC4_RETFI|nr:hypothetical protein RFI_07924 [Reticulomyxa filosa]|eukprot:ETO29203.1 hypothetical protein RFI_07924 [Reticulomyxa filosa]
MSKKIFQSLKDLPIPLSESQCVLHKHELLICGGAYERDCYSYHILKNEYKFICEYPSDVTLNGHCVVKLVNNNKDSNEISLLSFRGSLKHTLMMKYVSVWSNDNEINESKKSTNYNQWIPFTENYDNPIYAGRAKANYWGMRAVIGGSNNNLLFITYFPKNISVLNLNTFQFIKDDTLPIDDYIQYQCFVSKSEDEQEIMETNEKKTKKKNEMLLFYRKIGLSIKYDEDSNTFQFHKLPVCNNIAPFNHYTYVYINNIILFFGGWNVFNTRKTWITFEYTLPISLSGCFGIFDDDNTNIHIIGGRTDKNFTVSTHMKTKVSNLINKRTQLVRFFSNFKTIFFFFFLIKHIYILLYETINSQKKK